MANARHFWLITEASALEIVKLADKRPDYQYEDAVWHVWNAIPAVYFPNHLPPGGGGGVRYSIEREAYRGVFPLEPWRQKPDVVVVRLQTILQQQQQQPNARPVIDSRDVLWIECKAPIKDVPSGWNKVMSEAAERLRIAHPTRRVYVILAIGLKWMPFLWDPVAPIQNPAGSPLAILKDNQQETWPVDPGMHMIGLGTLPGQTHVFQQNGALIVDPRAAYTTDWWTLDANGNPVNMPDFVLLENFFTLVQVTQYQGSNPPEF